MIFQYLVYEGLNYGSVVFRQAHQSDGYAVSGFSFRYSQKIFGAHFKEVSQLGDVVDRGQRPTLFPIGISSHRYATGLGNGVLAQSSSFPEFFQALAESNAVGRFFRRVFFIQDSHIFQLKQNAPLRRGRILGTD